MKYQFIDNYRLEFRIGKMCHVLLVSRSGYYSWKKKGLSLRTQSNLTLTERIRQIYQRHHGRYGSPRITEVLRDQGLHCSKNRIARLMKVQGIASKLKRQFKITTQSKHTHPVIENILNRQFYAEKANTIWVSDITYIWTKEGWLYLAAILDVYSRKIVGWSMGCDLDKALVLEALNKALMQRKPEFGCIHHSDRGSQYACPQYQDILRRHGFIASMSRKGDCYDNAMMESFFHTLKTELVYREKYESKIQAQNSVFSYIEIFYNRQRKHSALNYKSPVQFEICYT